MDNPDNASSQTAENQVEGSPESVVSQQASTPTLDLSANGIANQPPYVSEHLTEDQKQLIAEAPAYGASDWIKSYPLEEALCRMEVASTQYALSEDPALQQQADKLSAYVNKLLQAGIKPSPEAMAQMPDSDRVALKQKVEHFTSQQQKVEVPQIQPLEPNQQEENVVSNLDSQAPGSEVNKSATTKPGKSNQQPSTSGPAQPEDSKALEDVLQKIHTAFQARQFQGNLPLVIKVDDEVVFKAIPGREPTVNKIQPEQVALLQKALEDPYGVQGSVRILVGRETLFHVKDGQVLTDKLGLAPQPTQTHSSQSQSAQPSPSQAVKPQANQSPAMTPQEQITALEAKIEQMQKQIDQLSTIDQKLDKFVNHPLFQNIGDERINHWLNNVHSQIYTTGQQEVTRTSNDLQQNQANLLSKVQQLWQGLKENITDVLHATHYGVQGIAGQAALGMTAASAKLASTVGQKLPDGSVVLENRNSNQRLEVNGNNVAIKERPQLDPQTLWDKYSQGLSADRPVQRTLAAAQNAIQDGMTKTAVEDMLKADPQFQKLQQQQGLKQAQQYAKQMTRSAIRREQQTQAKEPQQHRQRSQNSDLQQ